MEGSGVLQSHCHAASNCYAASCYPCCILLPHCILLPVLQPWALLLLLGSGSGFTAMQQ